MLNDSLRIDTFANQHVLHDEAVRDDAIGQPEREALDVLLHRSAKAVSLAFRGQTAWHSLPPCSKLSMMKRTLGFMSPLNESQAQEIQLASPKEVHAAAEYDRDLREDLRLCLDKTSLLLSCRATDSPGPGVAKRLSAGDASGLHRRPIPDDFAVPLIFRQ